MKTIVPRTVQEIGAAHSRSQSESEPLPIEDFKSREAYVFLGPPGIGKTEAFKQEAVDRQGVYVSARDFNTFKDRPEWHDTTLFIDGLDETRAGQVDGLTPFDNIRAKLYDLGCPRFRLSCREADWFGATDSKRLAAVSPDRSIAVLRLDPLSDEDVRKILRANLDVRDADKFIDEARKKGVQGLLTNPKSLEMLALAVGRGGDWPGTRMETFEMACRTLVEEHDTDHMVATRDSFGVPELMEASGRLSALLLLTGFAGFDLPGTESKSGLIALEQLPGQNMGIHLRSLQSKLFESPFPDPATPIHRQVAEFLGGRYLAGLFDDGLPVGRILALVTGHDGMVVSGFRGLTAWLAAHARAGRSEIIRRDVVGTVLYGDVSRFSIDEKHLLLDCLRMKVKDNDRSFTLDHLGSRLGDLVTSDMADTVQEILDEPLRDEPTQAFTVVMLKALSHAVLLPDMDESLMQILRDDTRWPSVRVSAFNALKHCRESDGGLLKELKTLADDLFVGKVRDRSDTLLVFLLARLYPDVISETEILKYLKMPTLSGLDLGHEYFWTGLLPGKSTTKQLAGLLDQLSGRYDELLQPGSDEHSVYFLRNLASALLARLLERSGEEADPNRLFRWLGLSAPDGDWPGDYDGRDQSAIRRWLEEHPPIWKSLLSMGIGHCESLPGSADPAEFSYCMYKEETYRLFNAECPPDYGLWCLDQAITAEDEKVVCWLLERVAQSLHYGRGNACLSREIVLKRLAEHPGLGKIYEEALENLQVRADLGNAAGENGKSRPRAGPNWHDHVKPYQGELRENRASPNLLYWLAKAYLGGYADVRGKTPKARLSVVLGNDNSLIEDILAGFRMTIERDDLPSYKEILRLGIRNRTSHLAYPFMAGLEEISDLKRLDQILAEESIARLALAIHYCVPMWPTMRNPADRPPSWINRLLVTQPAIVADVLVRFALARLRNRKEANALNDLADSEAHKHVARLATMPLLEKFPVRCTSGQLSNLNCLLLSASKRCRQEDLLNLIDDKLAQSGMNIAQRIHWLTAGFFLSPDAYAQQLESYVAGKERRIRFLAEAVSGRLQLPRSMRRRQSVTTLRLLIRLIGTSYRPCSFDGDSKEGGWYSPEMGTAQQVEGYIGQLATISLPQAGDALRELLSEENLRPWRSRLVDAAYQQNAVRREADFRYCDLHQVLETLDAKSPANAVDLAVLTYARLKEIANDTRRGNASGWRQFWNVDKHNRPLRPRPENACRDALVAGLKARLNAFDIDVQPEGHYANGKRADIRVACRDFNVPVEIKRSCHRDLWSAIRTQLIKGYAEDPGSGGYGIYLVFWFGNTEHCRVTPPASGTIPTNPAELEERLKLSLADEQKFRIQVCVIDVAIPNP